MPDLLAIISKAHFESAGTITDVGDHLRIDRYTSANRALKSLGDGGRLFLVTVRPPERLWLVGVLEDPKFDGKEWVAPVASKIAIVDITKQRERFVFKSGKGIAPGAMGAALQTPRELAESDVAMLEAAIGGAVADDPDEPVELRRVDDREALAHRIEVSKSARAKCATCEQPMTKGSVRLAEVYMHGDIRNPIYRYHHLACGVTAVPMVVRTALRTLADPALVPDRDAIAAQIEARLETLAAEQRARYTPKAAAPTSTAGSALIAQLVDDPDDAAALAVLADELTAHDDPRGELIAVQLALATAASDELIARRDELMRVLAPKLDRGDRAQWSVGFVRRIELVGKTAKRMDELAGLWQHPSLPLVRELRLEFHSAREGGPAVAGLVAVAPRSLQRLELGGNPDHVLGDAAPLVAALPKLAALALCGRTDLGAVAHGTLARLELAVGAAPEEFARAFDALLPARLPAVRALALLATLPRVLVPAPMPFAPLVEVLVRRDWLRQLEILELGRMRVEPDDIAALARALGKKQLARLDLATCDVALRSRPALAALCTELEFPSTAVAAAAAEATHAEHTAKPEWGVGKIVNRKDGKLEIKFGKHGVKVFKADAPFLKLT